MGAGDDEDGVGLVDAGDEGLLAVEDPLVTVLLRRGGDVVAVGAGVGLGDAESADEFTGGDTGQPALSLVGGAEGGDDGTADRRGHDEHQKAASLGGQFLLDDGELEEPRTAAAVLLGKVHPDEAEFAGFLPQFGGVLVGVGLLDHVLVAVLFGECTDGLAQLLLLRGVVERHADLGL